jgi:hypothetical protein
VCSGRSRASARPTPSTWWGTRHMWGTAKPAARHVAQVSICLVGVGCCDISVSAASASVMDRGGWNWGTARPAVRHAAQVSALTVFPPSVCVFKVFSTGLCSRSKACSPSEYLASWVCCQVCRWVVLLCVCGCRQWLVTAVLNLVCSKWGTARPAARHAAQVSAFCLLVILSYTHTMCTPSCF